MTSPSEPSQPSHAESGDLEFETELAQAERSLTDLKARYHQIMQDFEQQAALQQRLQEVNQEWQKYQLPQMQQELQQVQTQLDELAVGLESALLTRRDRLRLYGKIFREGFFQEVFWQVVRYVGLGIVLGWLLKSYAG